MLTRNKYNWETEIIVWTCFMDSYIYIYDMTGQHAHTFTPWGQFILAKSTWACYWKVEGNRRTERKPAQTRGEHV